MGQQEGWKDKPIEVAVKEMAGGLKPCPFCGGEAVGRDVLGYRLAGCLSCNEWIDAEIWNRRTSDPAREAPKPGPATEGKTVWFIAELPDPCKAVGEGLYENPDTANRHCGNLVANTLKPLMVWEARVVLAEHGRGEPKPPT